MRRTHPRYGASRTLLGGYPDVNRRTIVDSWNEFETVAEFNPQMDVWTREHERVLNICLDALNEDAKGHAQEGRARSDGEEYGPGSDFAPKD